MTARWALRQRRRQTASGAVAFGTRSARTNVAVTHSNTQVMMVEMDNNTDKLEQELGKMDMQNLLEVQQDDGELVDICSMAVLQHGQQQELQVKPLMERGVDDSMLNSWQAANGQQKLCGSTMSISVAVNIGEHGDATLIEQVQQREQQNYHQEANEVRCDRDGQMEAGSRDDSRRLHQPRGGHVVEQQLQQHEEQHGHGHEHMVLQHPPTLPCPAPFTPC